MVQQKKIYPSAWIVFARQRSIHRLAYHCQCLANGFNIASADTAIVREK